jgi:hypothetical protein
VRRSNSNIYYGQRSQFGKPYDGRRDYAGAACFCWHLGRWGLGDSFRKTRERQDAQAVFDGTALAVWRYEPADWQAELARRRDVLAKYNKSAGCFMPLYYGMLLVFGAIPVGIVFYLGERIPSTLRSIFIMVAFILGLGLLFNVFSKMRLDHKNNSKMAHAERFSAPWIVWGPHGFYHEVDGHLTLRRLWGARYEGGEMMVVSVIIVRSRRGCLLKNHDIYVPAAHRHDAGVLADRYQETGKGRSRR